MGRHIKLYPGSRAALALALLAMSAGEAGAREVFFGSPRVVTTNADDAQWVVSADIDGDGDNDILSASADDGKIAWYENLDGTGEYGTQQVIEGGIDSPKSVATADIDGDRDLDVLSASSNDDRIAWYENTNGAGAFGGRQDITTTANGALVVHGG